MCILGRLWFVLQFLLLTKINSMGLCFGWVNLQRALVRNKSTGPLPEVGMGMNDHTKIPQLYQAENNLWLVDFPGGNSIEDYGDYWQYFQHYQVLLCYYFHSRSILHLHTIPLLDTKYITYNSLLLC